MTHDGMNVHDVTNSVMNMQEVYLVNKNMNVSVGGDWEWLEIGNSSSGGGCSDVIESYG